MTACADALEQMTQITTDSGGKPNLQQAKELESKMKLMEGALQKMNNVRLIGSDYLL